MKRLRRWLFNLVAGMSAALAILVLVDWCTHPWRQAVYVSSSARIVDTDRVTDHCTIQTGSGLVLIVFTTERQAAAEAKPQPIFQRFSGPAGGLDVLPDTPAGKLGFGTVSGSFIARPWGTTVSIYVTRIGLVVPSWFLILIFLTLPATWLRRYVRRIPLGHCQMCGYDLRATPDRCPECGTEATG